VGYLELMTGLFRILSDPRAGHARQEPQDGSGVGRGLDLVTTIRYEGMQTPRRRHRPTVADRVILLSAEASKSKMDRGRDLFPCMAIAAVNSHALDGSNLSRLQHTYRIGNPGSQEGIYSEHI
jgi:hypothetical protein